MLLAFIAVPLIEIYLIVQVGQVIGGWETVGLLLAISVLGTWLVKREGRRAFHALRDAMATGKLPDREVLDAALVLVGGTLLLTPGFLTDALGLMFVIPMTRPPARSLVTRLVKRRILASASRMTGGVRPPGSAPRRPSDDTQSEVIEGEIIDRHDERP